MKLTATDPARFNESTIEWCDRHPIRQQAYEVKGWLLYFQRTGLVMVPYQSASTGWNCVVVWGDDIYPVGGYDLFVSDREIIRAIHLGTDDLDAGDQ